MSFLLVSCFIQKYQKIQKFVTKNHGKSNFIQKIDEQFINSKSDDSHKIFFLKELGKYKQENINNYLRDDLFHRYRDNSILQGKIFDAITEQNNPDNITFFIELIQSESNYSQKSIDAISGFGKEYFKVWIQYLNTTESSFKKNLSEIIKKMKYKPIGLLLEEYLSQGNKQKKRLQFYLKNYKLILSQVITQFILSKKIKNYGEISKLTPMVGYQYLENYTPLIQSDSKQISKIAIKIFCSFSDNCIPQLKLIYPNLSELDNQKKIFSICDSIGSYKAFSTLEYWLENSDDVFEKKAIIFAMSNITNSLPTAFIELTSDRNLAYNVFKTIPKFIKIAPNSVIDAYFQSSEIGKINFLRYFFEHDNNNLIENILDKYNLLTSNLKLFILSNISNKPYNDIYYDFILKTIMNKDKDVFIASSYYCSQNKSVFSEYIMNNFDEIATDSYRIKYILNVFESTKNKDEIEFLIRKYLKYFPQQINIADAFGNKFINNRYLNSPTINKFFGEDSLQSRIHAYVNILTLIKSMRVAYVQVFADLSKKYYFSCSLEDRLKIIAFTYKYSKSEILQYLIDNYERMSLIEKKFLNSSLNKFELATINEHLQRLIYLGDEEDLILIEDMINYRFGNNNLLDIYGEMLGYYYYKINNFDKAQDYLEKIEDKSDFNVNMLKIIEMCLNSKQFTKKYRSGNNPNPVNPVNPAFIYKSLQDSIIYTNWIVNHANLHNKNIEVYKNKNIEYSNQLLVLEDNFKTYFEKINNCKEDNSFVDYKLENNLLINVLSSKCLDKLYCGNITLEPDNGFIFFEIVLECFNPTKFSIELEPSNFLLIAASEKFHIFEKSEFYYKFNKGEYNLHCQISANSNLILPIMFVIPLDESSVTFHFRNKNIVSITTPYEFTPKFKIDRLNIR